MGRQTDRSDLNLKLSSTASSGVAVAATRQKPLLPPMNRSRVAPLVEGPSDAGRGPQRGTRTSLPQPHCAFLHPTRATPLTPVGDEFVRGKGRSAAASRVRWVCKPYGWLFGRIAAWNRLPSRSTVGFLSVAELWHTLSLASGPPGLPWGYGIALIRIVY